MYGESSYNTEKEDIYNEIKYFLDNHPISELLNVIADVVANEGYDK
jgi:hypothetical protein